MLTFGSIVARIYLSGRPSPMGNGPSQFRRQQCSLSATPSLSLCTTQQNNFCSRQRGVQKLEGRIGQSYVLEHCKERLAHALQHHLSQKDPYDSKNTHLYSYDHHAPSEGACVDPLSYLEQIDRGEKCGSRTHEAGRLKLLGKQENI
mmetsp:Transcript_11185/g.15016  ORF Transcript_11185/g.15016 Transcript_11185/m.15016 type:complete len:147 (-) Transcript_11185:499-939(-)